ncbi:hypothetical protein BRI6_1341 [plant metagenome]|uniref:Uncharacterized protein n=2 Tax=plant metagenome TaxID=1297885 RepID=A0A484S7R6_9ZZZZ
MMADSLHVAVHLVVPSGVSFYCSSPCRRTCSAGAFAPHLALPSAQPSSVQASCLGRVWPAAIGAFAGGLVASSAAPPDRRRPERQRRAKAEGKIEGCSTTVRARPVCTWGWRGTHLMATACRERCQCLATIGESACFARQGAMGLSGVTP